MTEPAATALDAATAASPITGGPTAGGPTDRYPWIAMAVVLLGTFMVILDTTIVNVALPQIGIALDRRDGIEWVVTSYLLAVGVAQPPTGWLADRFGRKRVFIGSMTVFVVGSLFAAVAPDLELLVAARVVQGLGGGAVMPVGMAMIYELFPPNRRGTALGIWGVAAMAGPAFGPVIGGYLVTAVSWHWLFLINLPVGIAAIAVALRLLRDTGYREDRRFDGVGLGIISVALVCWLTAFAQAGDWGWASPATLSLIVVGAGLMVAFAAWEQWVTHPVIDLSMFRAPVFSLTMVVIALTTVVQYAILVFVPLQLQTVRDLSALRVGTMLVPTALAAAVTFPLGGRITDRIGPRYPVMVGAALLGVSAFVLGHLQLDSSTLHIEVALVLQGFGFGLAMMPNSVTGMNALPSRFVAQATSIRQLTLRVAASFGVAVLSTVVVAGGGAAETEIAVGGRADAQVAYNHVFLIAAAVAAVAVVLGAFLPDSARNRALQDERARELDGATAGAAGEPGDAVPAMVVD
jgi:DHA2 family multidrug resistance protein